MKKISTLFKENKISSQESLSQIIKFLEKEGINLTDKNLNSIKKNLSQSFIDLEGNSHINVLTEDNAKEELFNFLKDSDSLVSIKKLSQILFSDKSLQVQFFKIADNANCSEIINIPFDERGLELSIIMLGKNSTLEINRMGDAKDFRTHSTIFLLDEGSSLNFKSFHSGEDSLQFSAETFFLKKNAVLDLSIASFSHKLAHHVLDIISLGRNTRSNSNFSFYMHKEDQHIFRIKNRFCNQDSFGEIRANGLLLDKAKADLHGIIEIDNNAQNTDSNLSEKILLLGEKAKCNASPVLNINTHDVKAAHGASIHQIDKEDLFYMQSRGINKEQAISLIREGFLTSPFEKISYDHPWKKKLLKTLRND